MLFDSYCHLLREMTHALCSISLSTSTIFICPSETDCFVKYEWMFVQSNNGSGSGRKKINERQCNIKLVLIKTERLSALPDPHHQNCFCLALCGTHLPLMVFRSHTLRVWGLKASQLCEELCMPPSDPGEIKADGYTQKKICIWAKMIHNTLSPLICKWIEHPVLLREDARLIVFIHAFIHSFLFSNRFILVRVAVDLEPVLGTLAARWEYILNGTAVYHIALCSHVQYTHSFTARVI